MNSTSNFSFVDEAFTEAMEDGDVPHYLNTLASFQRLNTYGLCIINVYGSAINVNFNEMHEYLKLNESGFTAWYT